MIIRRFVAALHQQDWATVVIEFLIVVAGIFVGLQVDDWNRSRVAALEERDLLVDLHRETQISIIITPTASIEVRSPNFNSVS